MSKIIGTVKAILIVIAVLRAFQGFMYLVSDVAEYLLRKVHKKHLKEQDA
jgi:hypothetical protein